MTAGQNVDAALSPTVANLAAAAVRIAVEGAVAEIVQRFGVIRPSTHEAINAGMLAARSLMTQIDDLNDQQRSQLESMRELLASSKDVALALDVNYYAEENERMRAAFQKMVDALKDGDGTEIELEFQMSGCEWCHQVWPKPDGSTQEQIEERARRHIFTCAKHPLRIERDALRGLLVDACRVLEREGLDDEAAELRARCGDHGSGQSSRARSVLPR